MKCARCGYSIKISCVHGTFYLHCSGHTNLNTCDQRISVDIRELERMVETELTKLLQDCPEEEGAVSPDDGQLRQIDTRIERLMAAYGESSAVTTQYLNQEITKLDGERQRLLQKKPVRTDALSRIEFSKLTLAEKKMVAASFLDRILLSENTAEVIWKV